MNEMMAAGKWEVFNENLLNDARITRAQLSEIEQRHKVSHWSSVKNGRLRVVFTTLCHVIRYGAFRTVRNVQYQHRLSPS